MDNKNISPNPQQPVDRVPAGQLPSALAELSEEAIGSLDALPAEFAVVCGCGCGLGGTTCSYEGDDE